MRIRWFFVFFLCASALRANSDVFIALEKVPAAETVTSFANRPGSEDATVKWLKKEDLLRFLRNGHVDLEPQNWPFKEKDNSISCKGVFFTVDGKGYLWELWTPTVMELFGPEHETCLLTLSGEGVKPGAPPSELIPPKASEVVAFCNGELPGTGSYMPLERADILRFLADGNVSVPRNDWLDLENKGWITVREPLLGFMKKTSPEDLKKGRVEVGNVSVRGMFSTRDGKIYYWDLRDDHLLHVQSPDGAECLIRTPEK